MAQTLKDSVRNAIAAAAGKVFAREGFEGATVAAIARQAGVSTGNVYRYFETKEALFDSVIDDGFVSRFLLLLRRRVRRARGHADLFALHPGEPYGLASEELLRFSIGNRLKVVILLGRARGSRLENMAGNLVEELVRRASSHFCAMGRRKPSPPVRLALERIYRGMVSTLVMILASFEDEKEIREAVGAYTRFHLAGLKALFENVGMRREKRRQRRNK